MVYLIISNDRMVVVTNAKCGVQLPMDIHKRMKSTDELAKFVT